MIKGLPDRLRDLRVKHGLSQRTVAKHLGASPSIVSGYETGERTPSTENLLALSYLYHCTTDFLLGRDLISNDQMINAEHLTAKQIQAIRDLVEAIRNRDK